MRTQRGSVLMLMPAAMLILLILGSIALDSAIAFLSQRELQDFTAGLANDLATRAIDDRAYYRGSTETLVLSQQNADELTRSAIAASAPARVLHLRVMARVLDTRVTVTATGESRYIFATAIPGVEHSVKIRASSTASVQS